MRRLVLPLVVSVAVLALTGGAALAHVGTPGGSSLGARAAVPPNTDPFTVGPRPPAVVDGPCTDASGRQQYPDGEGHDHLDIEIHRAACRISQQAFLPLEEELSSDPGTEADEVLGEMDVEGDVAAVAIAYPRAGILFFDVSNPAAPRFLRRYNGDSCEGTAIDVDCGAFVDLSEDGKTAFLSVQQISVIPGGNPGGIAPPARPGVQVVDVETGSLASEQPVLSVGGVHTSRDHVVPEGPSSAEEPRAPGQYLFSVANGMGIRVSRVVDLPIGGPLLEDVGLIEMDEAHDMFIQDDPLTGRTFMYVAAGFDTGFLVYDVTDPSAAVGANEGLVAQWDLTPECREDWYSHTIDVTTRGGRRYVTMPTEAFDFGEMAQEDQDKGCGKISGNGDKAAPMWIVDATDLDALGRGSFADATNGDGEDTQGEVKAASEKALVTTWTNAAARPAQNINFSPHNQQIVGDRIYLSGYHAGVTALDASAAFAGRNERPKEIGFIVPAGTPTRPIYGQAVDPLIPFFSAFIGYRPLIWDMVVHKGSILAADMTGGFYAFGEPPAETGEGPGGGTDDGTPGGSGNAGSGNAGGGNAGGGGGTGGGTTTQPSTPSGGTQGEAAQACASTAGFSRATARRRGRGLAFSFRRRVDRPVTVDVFRVGAGRRVIGERRVARFAGRTRSFAWNGRGRRIRDGYYFARLRMRMADGPDDVRRVALRRRNGRFSVRPAFYRRESCGLLRSYKLERPVFGGRGRRSLGIAFRLGRQARVNVVVRRGRRVVRRFATASRAPRRTHRLRLAVRGLRRGDHRVTITVRRGSRVLRSTLTSRRL